MSFINRGFGAGHISNFKGEPLTDEQLARLVPAAFATEAHGSRSERYSYIPTTAVIEGMRREGFFPVSAKQGNSRVEGKREFTKHMIRFRHAGDTGSLKVGDTLPEVVMVNSHDGTTQYNLMAGLFRIKCLNGLMVADKELSSVKVPHKGDIVGQVIEGSYTVLQDSAKALEAVERWSAIDLAPAEAEIMAEAAHVLRFGDAEGQTDTFIRPAQLLGFRRRDDVGTDLWRTFNRVQENVIRGGVHARGRDADGRIRNVTTREVKGIDADVKLNKALWMLAEGMAKLKAA